MKDLAGRVCGVGLSNFLVYFHGKFLHFFANTEAAVSDVAMECIHSDDLLHKSSRNTILEQVRAEPVSFLDLLEEYQSDPEICIAALLSCSNEVYDDQILPKILETVVQHLPHFSDHKPVLLRFIESSNTQAMQTYLKCFGSRVLESHDFIKKMAEQKGFAKFFKCLPLANRLDPELLRLAVESVPDIAIPDFLRVIPSEALTEHEFILFHAVERPTIHIRNDQVPASFWRNRDFVFKWSEKRKTVPIESLPIEFNVDRELCLSLYRSQSDVVEVVRWVPKPLLADKSFVMECLRHHPEIFQYCDKELQKDFDLLLEASVSAVRDNTFCSFTNRLGTPSLVSFAQATQIKIQSHDNFMALLACMWKSRQINLHPLVILNCDEETTRGLTTTIAECLGIPGHACLVRLKCVWDEVVLLVIENEDLSALVPLVHAKNLVHGVLKTIEEKRTVALEYFPAELWTHRSFVVWAALKGKFNKAIASEFCEDRSICYSYYKHSSAVRNQTWHWIADNVKADRDFVFDCTRIDPLILTHGHTDEIRYDFKLMLNAVYHTSKVNVLVETARVGGWGDAFIVFAKCVRAKMATRYAFQTFETEVRGCCLFRAKHVSGLLQLIGSYLGHVTDGSELAQLRRVSGYHSIFFLALGGDINELCKINKLLPDKPLVL